jgi:hypothetical protein
MASLKHGLSHHPLYHTYIGMVNRCLNPNSHSYNYYGGRGIAVCKRWLGKNGFKNFIADMGNKPSPKHSIDRYPNNDGNYEPSNCRWATQKQQTNNKRNPFAGCLIAAEVARLSGYSRERIRQLSYPRNRKKSLLAEFKESIIVTGKKTIIIYKPQVVDFLINHKKQHEYKHAS